MGKWKQRVKLFVLLIVAAGAVAFAARSLLRGRQFPKAALERQEEKVDAETLEVVTRTLGEWEKLGHNERGYYKHPETGRYTMTYSFECPGCRTKLPRAVDSPEHFKCPKCGTMVSPP